MEKFKEAIVNHKKVVIIVSLVIVVLATIISIIISSSSDPERTEITKAITNSLGHNNFNVTDVILKQDNWYLTGITSTSQQTKGNPSLFLLQKNDDQFETALGPGTMFSPEVLYEAGAPDEVFRYFHGDDTIWLNSDEVRPTISARDLENTNSLIEKYANENNINLTKVFVKEGSQNQWEENLRQPNVIYYYDFVVSLNSPDSEEFSIRIKSSEGVDTGTMTNGNGTVVAEKTYSIDYDWRKGIY